MRIKLRLNGPGPSGSMPGLKSANLRNEIHGLKPITVKNRSESFALNIPFKTSNFGAPSPPMADDAGKRVVIKAGDYFKYVNICSADRAENHTT